jgi:hypothetical protein
MEIDMTSYDIYRIDSAFSRPKLLSFGTQDEALAYLVTIGVTCIEEDQSAPGCFDGIGKDGRVYSIEKKLKKVA